ncbi:MAG: DUF2442 domain-containing protein [Anaerolineae bacterium]|nr:DUF2442 domain-containing protein [Anaerolineae bacterium]
MDKVDTDEIVDIVGEGELIYVPRNDAVAAQVTKDELIVTTRDGRTIHTPLTWFPFLLNASEAQRQNFQVMGTLVLWDDLDEIVSMEVILLGRSGT